MGLLNKQTILQVEDLPTQDVKVPEWGGTVRIRGLSGDQASKFSKKLVKIGPDGKPQVLQLDNFMAELLALTIVDENGEHVFNQADVEALGKKSAAVLKRLSDIAASLSGLGDEAARDAEKNSQTPDGVLLTG